jgi:hypothetical protein
MTSKQLLACKQELCSVGITNDKDLWNTPLS